MSDIIRVTPDQFRRCKTLIKNQCCNYRDGECLFLDCECPQMITFSLICKWFKNAVLPNDTELYVQLIKPPNTDNCVVCGNKFIKRTNNAKYCDKCRVLIRRRKIAEYKRKCVHKGNHSEP